MTVTYTDKAKADVALLDSLCNKEVFVSGGAIRDLLLSRPVIDIDLVVPQDAVTIATQLAKDIDGTLVSLDEDNGIYRVVSRDGRYFDFSQYRDGAKAIDEDLRYRDFTINALALRWQDFLSGDITKLIDPTNGLHDIKKGIIRACAKDSFHKDPLRILRAYRFLVELGFEIEPTTLTYLLECQGKGRLDEVAKERINYEITRIFETNIAWKAINKMAELKTLLILFPELEIAQGVEQPGFHHLDVFGHSLETLKMVEKVIESPHTFFKHSETVRAWLKENKQRIIALKWAALFHDIGKPVVKGQKGERVTFYNHDREGALILKGISRRFRWSRSLEEIVLKLVALHMRPFHLLNDLRRGGPSSRALRRLLNATGQDYVGLFLLSMADTLAGSGPLKPPELEEEIATLFDHVHTFWTETLRPIRSKERIITGKDVMNILGIPQGPLVGRALDALEQAQCDGLVKDRTSSIAFLKKWIKNQGNAPRSSFSQSK
ncbi:tRNA nucleotidyltransferase, CC-adding [Dissulfuribacter thermophilus]|uniref:tRNA nucleotidyltransferase, CC-adding n=1 Tax=Dissulfuribacter thermophilus TaxID=1156395 RepID=A0A1B9F811_9BACT|nr:HD domain-containing protein [Dissulfuribacter thermophilus]OCC15945.1 tRNA nucleotidyltransferase, CC-adding [Dissulfuribacter thermophilus]